MMAPMYIVLGVLTVVLAAALVVLGGLLADGGAVTGTVVQKLR